MTDPNDPDLTGQDWPDPPDVLPPPPPGEEPGESLPPPQQVITHGGWTAPAGLPMFQVSRGPVSGEAAEWDDPDEEAELERLLAHERAAQSRHRSRTRQLQDIQNTALTILIPLIGFISAVLLAGVARLVWLL